MQAFRLVSHRAPLRAATRCLATTASPAHTISHTSSSSTSAIPLSNVEAQWEKLSNEERSTVHQQLEELQKKDWKLLSIDEKKAAWYVAFGPHGPRTPVSKPGDSLRVFLGTLGLIGAAGVLFVTARMFGGTPPRTLTKEWEEASNERALEAKINPITGISSEGYSGKGFVQSK
ncbi:hypothetical protein PLICRDRAFT_41432 [Plicaturopsis crispa FD-325 SS-3]|nr:hypothetical protein PLICRDRAFT_41432 [Plicaturopsis crispa FD-325 SS-3]